jgi:hypothetical protein
MPSDFLPNGRRGPLIEWCENFKLEFALIASGLGFSAAEILLILADLNWIIYNCRAAADAQSNSSAWVQFRDTHLDGDPGSQVGVPPNTTGPTPPSGTVPPNGIIARIRAVVQRIKSVPGYNPAIGQTLRIVPTTTPTDDSNAKPNTRGKALPMFKVELRCKRLDFDAVFTRCRRDGESEPTDLGLSVGTTFVDERPPLQPGKPEVRTYEQIYVRDNQPVGQWSDAVRVTLQP